MEIEKKALDLHYLSCSFWCENKFRGESPVECILCHWRWQDLFAPVPSSRWLGNYCCNLNHTASVKRHQCPRSKSGHTNQQIQPFDPYCRGLTIISPHNPTFVNTTITFTAHRAQLFNERDHNTTRLEALPQTGSLGSSRR